MGCGDYAVQQVLVGLHRVGIVGLRQACAKIADSGPDEPEAVVDALLEELRADNYVEDEQFEDYRTALWREYLRFLGRDFSAHFSTIHVVVRGDADEARDRLVELCRSVLADFELRPDLELQSAGDDDPRPELLIGDSPVARGLPSRKELKATIRRRLSDW